MRTVATYTKKTIGIVAYCFQFLFNKINLSGRVVSTVEKKLLNKKKTLPLFREKTELRTNTLHASLQKLYRKLKILKYHKFRK